MKGEKYDKIQERVAGRFEIKPRFVQPGGVKDYAKW